MSRKYKSTGIVFLTIGIVILIYNFFKMYSLVGECSNGAPCKAYNNWGIVNMVAIGLVVIGIAIIIISWIKKRRTSI
jgi:hypothetical protein